jgi:HK97 family phage prohead protease
MTAQDAEFIASRNLQVQEIARLFRMPLHKIGVMEGGLGKSLEQLDQDYVNNTVSSYLERWEAKISQTFDLADEDLTVEFDVSKFLRASLQTRYNAYRTGIVGMFLKPNEARRAEGLPDDEGGDTLYQPTNVAPIGFDPSGSESGPGSDLTGAAAPGGAGDPAAVQTDEADSGYVKGFEMTDLATVEEFRAAARRGAAVPGSVFRLATDVATEIPGADRTLRFCFSDGSVDRAGDTIDPKGWELDAFNLNPVALWAHNSWDPPIGRAKNVGVVGKRLMGDIEFAGAKDYEFADTIFRLIKGKFINAVSVGFNPLEWSFVNDKDRPYGIDFKRQELLEISPCPVPCNGNALAEARAKGIDTRPLRAWAEKILDGEGGTVLLSRATLEDIFKATNTPHAARTKYRKLLEHKASDWKCGASRDLAIDEDDSWDGPAAEASIFDHAGGDDFDPAIASKGFLAYDATEPKLRGSYKLPIARVVNGEMKAVAAGIRAAASRLPDTDVPDGVKESARAVIDHYEAEMADDDKSETLPIGNCGRGADMACGMSDPEECAVHCSAAKSKAMHKAGRRISKDNIAKLEKAKEHIQAVLDSNSDEGDSEDDTVDGGQFPAEDEAGKGADAKEKPLTAKERARATLAEAGRTV